MLATLRSLSLKRIVATILILVVVLFGGFAAGRASASQPHMQSALGHLRSAKSELEVAEENKGGHRTKALNLVNKAIAEVEKGVQYAQKH